MDDNKDLIPQIPEEEPQEETKDQAFFKLILRLVIGGYLIYLAFQLFTGDAQGTARVICMIAAVIFVLAGAAFIAWSIKRLLDRK